MRELANAATSNWLILTVVLTAAFCFAIFAAYLRGPTFESTTQLFVPVVPVPNYGTLLEGGQVEQSATRSIRQLASSEWAFNSMIDSVGVPLDDAARIHVSTNSIPGTTIVELRVTASDQLVAADAANALARNVQVLWHVANAGRNFDSSSQIVIASPAQVAPSLSVVQVLRPGLESAAIALSICAAYVLVFKSAERSREAMNLHVVSSRLRAYRGNE